MENTILKSLFDVYSERQLTQRIEDEAIADFIKTDEEYMCISRFQN
ncbi:hypothetical protein [Thomasclavelia saccharogumia]|nr:hypothetical protein [Thomasclavelia saccharogumia]